MKGKPLTLAEARAKAQTAATLPKKQATVNVNSEELPKKQAVAEPQQLAQSAQGAAQATTPPETPEKPAKTRKHPAARLRPSRKTPQEAPQDPHNAPQHSVERTPEVQREADAAFAIPYEAPFFDFDHAIHDPEAELASRELCRRHLLPFIQRFRPKYKAGWVHADVCRRLERFVRDVENGKEPRLLLLMPPRSGKSEIGSRHLSPWILGQHPDWEIIAASHTASLTMSFSRYLRDLMMSEAYNAVFPDAVLDPSSRAVENWNLTKGGGYLAAGVGTGITGRGAHVLVIDDVVKDIEAADSVTIRDNTWEWYISTAYTRLAPGGGVLGILTWWHEDDWAGRIQQAMEAGDGDKFEIVKYPAINEVGDEYILEDDSIIEIPQNTPVPVGARMTRPHNTAIHPERYTTEAMLRIKRNAIAAGMKRTWDALYQQNPIPDEGNYFSKEYFRHYSTAPTRRDIYVYQAWDFAISEGKESDFNVGVTIGVDHRDSIYVLDVTRFKTSDGNMLIETVVDYARQWMPDTLGVEDGQIWKALESQFSKVCDEKKYWPSFEVLKPLTDKMVRASPLRGRMQAGKVYFDKEATYWRELQKEMLHFPAGKHDDCHTYETLIDSPRGRKMMGELVDGDEVYTYDGANVVVARVREHRCTGTKFVIAVTFSDGTVVETTAGHPFLTERGYVYAGDLTTADNVVRRTQWPSNDMASSGARSATGITSQQRCWQTASAHGCIAMLTKLKKRLFLKAGTFITSTATRITTHLRTLSVSLRTITHPSIVRADALQAVQINRSNISQTYESSLQKQGVASTSVRENSEKLLPGSEPALSVERTSICQLPRATELFSAQIGVETNGTTHSAKKTMRLAGNVSTVVETSCQENTESVTRCSVLRRAGTNTGTQMAKLSGDARPVVIAMNLVREMRRLFARSAEGQGLNNPAPVVGERLYPASRTAMFSAIEHVLTSSDDSKMIQRASHDTSRGFVRVVSIREIGFRQTYNFEVEKTHNYLVHNGVVVHNCVDSLAWAVRLTLTRSAPQRKDLPPTPKSWKDDLDQFIDGSLAGASHMAA